MPEKNKAWMTPGTAGFRAMPHVEVTFDAKTIIVVAGVCLSADVTGLVPEEVAGQFWPRFWVGLVDEFESRLERNLAGIADAGGPVLERARADASRMLAARFQACGGPASAA
jgi:hypothetical protein